MTFRRIVRTTLDKPETPVLTAGCFASASIRPSARPRRSDDADLVPRRQLHCEIAHSRGLTRIVRRGSLAVGRRDASADAVVFAPAMGEDEQMAWSKYPAIARKALRDVAEIKAAAIGTRQAQERISADIRRLHEELVLRPEIGAVNFAAFNPYQDAFQGRDIVLVASGPTLVHYEPIAGAIHIGVNTVVADARIPLDFAFAQDFHQHGRALHSAALFESARADCTYFFGVVAHPQRYQWMEASQSITARFGATRYFVDASPSSTVEYDIRFNPLADFFTVVFPALHFALFTNPSRIYLAGCDTTYFGHFDGTPQPGTSSQIRSHLTHRIAGYRMMREFARRVFPETEIVSINPVTLAGLFSDQFTPGVEYRRSAGQPALAAADFGPDAIAAYVEAHIDEIRR